MEFHGDYEDLGFWLETYTEDPLQGLDPHASLTKKVKAASATTSSQIGKLPVKSEINRRMGVYLESDPKPEKKIIELPLDEYRQLVHQPRNAGTLCLCVSGLPSC